MNDNYEKMLSYIKRSGFQYEEKEEASCKRIDVQYGLKKSVVKVYNTGTIQVQGAESKLRENLSVAKRAIENEENIGDILPFDIENFPQVISERIPEVDPIIVRFIQEAIISIKAGSNLGCAFLLGGASEKAILILVETYKNAINDEDRKTKFASKVNNKSISKVFDEFKGSWKTSLNKPTGSGWTNDLEIKIEQIFQFCRICRNETGHPHLPPNLDKGVLLANMGQFVKYVEDLYELIKFYETNNVSF